MAATNNTANTSNTGKNNSTNRKLPSNRKNIKAEGKSVIMDKMAQFQTRNLPILILIAVFLIFILFQYLKAHKESDDRLRHKIDTEIRKKLYYADEYY
tara:strand:- start:546 stop:839 length:294 start_codon:yes stop_codon:yes gene_type:complete